MPYLLFSEALLPAWRRGRPASPSRGAEADLGLGPRVRAWGGAGTARAPGERAREGRGPPAPGGGGRRDRKGLVRALGFRRVRVPGRQACACAPLPARVGAVVRTGGAVPRDAIWRPLPRASVRVAAGPARPCQLSPEPIFPLPPHRYVRQVQRGRRSASRVTFYLVSKSG